ncbi:MAG: plastocyanin/azurin family copper-binding protein [Verrucomicrobiota bacterium]
MLNLIRIFSLPIALAGLCGCGPQPLPPEPEIKQEVKTISNAAGEVSDTIKITSFDNMRYDKMLLEVPAGQKITLTLVNEGRMPKEAMAHNLVILKLGKDVNAYVAEAIFSDESDYIPANYADWVVAHTKMLGAGESDTITFIAPDKPGEYPFVCTFPGHSAAGMKGIMRVVVETPL